MASGRFPTSYRRDRRLIKTPWTWAWTALLIAFLAYLPNILTTRSIFGIPLTTNEVLGIGISNIDITLIVMIGAIALNMLTGVAGLISFGNAAFFAVGALAASVTAIQWHWPFALALLASGVFGAVVGAVVGLPSLRIRGFYLLLSTLALQYLMVYVFLSYENHYFGPVGVNFAPPSFLGFQLADDTRWYTFLVILTGVVIIVCKNILRTRAGRAFLSIRDNDIAAAAVGVPLARTKLQAFAFSSFLISVAGALYVYYLSNATSETFSLSLALSFVAMILIGGLGSTLGAVLGALVWQLLPTAISTLAGGGTSSPGFIGANAAQLSQVVLGGIVIVLLIAKPDGLQGIWVSITKVFRRWPFSA